jgi:hypothetical protein
MSTNPLLSQKVAHANPVTCQRQANTSTCPGMKRGSVEGPARLVTRDRASIDIEDVRAITVGASGRTGPAIYCHYGDRN